MMARRLRVALWSVGLLATTSSCVADSNGELLVSAAASLTDAFADIETAFEASYPEVDVVLNLGSSAALREQIMEGARADVFASANEANMAPLIDLGAVTNAKTFATNVLQIAVPAGNPAGITGLDDFGREDLLIGLCEEAVPCGEFARQVLHNAGVTAAVDTNEPDVRALLTKLELGELDAGITYATDVIAAGGTVEGIDISESDNVLATYPIAVLVEAPNQDAALAFVAFVLSADGQEILSRNGFLTP